MHVRGKGCPDAEPIRLRRDTVKLTTTNLEELVWWLSTWLRISILPKGGDLPIVELKYVLCLIPLMRHVRVGTIIDVIRGIEAGGCLHEDANLPNSELSAFFFSFVYLPTTDLQDSSTIHGQTIIT